MRSQPAPWAPRRRAGEQYTRTVRSDRGHRRKGFVPPPDANGESDTFTPQFTKPFGTPPMSVGYRYAARTRNLKEPPRRPPGWVASGRWLCVVSGRGTDLKSPLAAATRLTECCAKFPFCHLRSSALVQLMDRPPKLPPVWVTSGRWLGVWYGRGTDLKSPLAAAPRQKERWANSFGQLSRLERRFILPQWRRRPARGASPAVWCWLGVSGRLARSQVLHGRRRPARGAAPAGWREQASHAQVVPTLPPRVGVARTGGPYPLA